MSDLGPTGNFPRGHINLQDEGELRIGVTVENNTVIIAFGKSISWFGLSRLEACQFADLIKKRAME